MDFAHLAGAAERQGDDDEPAVDEDGAELLDDVLQPRCAATSSSRRIECRRTRSTLFIAATHAQSAWEHATRLVIKSPVKRCGKTRLQEIAGRARPPAAAHRRTSASPPWSARSTPRTRRRSCSTRPTACSPPAAVSAPKAPRTCAASSTAGHSRGWPYIRWNMSAHAQREACPTFAMAIISGIGDLPDTIEDRAVVVSPAPPSAGRAGRPVPPAPRRPTAADSH